MPISPAKAERLRKLSNPDGIIAALAMDQRKSLRRMIAEAAAVPLENICDGRLAEFKSAVTRRLTKHASAVLLDPEFGRDAFSQRSPACGLLATYELDGYENPRPHRMLALMPEFSVRRLRDLGADGIKILLSYTPFDDEASNDHKKAMIERIGHECDALDMPFFLEPVSYDPAGGAPNTFDFAKRKPEIVIRSMEEFSKDIYKVDVLKVEFPVNVTFVEGSSVYAGRTAYLHSEALELYRRADEVARRPYIYLSAGVSTNQFTESLRLAAEAGVGFSGVLCGRATWQEGIPIYATDGLEALDRWLAHAGVRNIAAINECLSAARPWQSRTP